MGKTGANNCGTPVPVVLRTIIKPFDCYLINVGGTNMADTENDVKVYFVTIPAHKYLHIRNYESVGYCLDTTQGRVFYFYHNPERFWKYVRPVKKL